VILRPCTGPAVRRLRKNTALVNNIYFRAMVFTVQ
jgi:hypothetical protein